MEQLTKDLAQVNPNSLSLGRPLPFSVYDKQGVLLLKAGAVFDLQRQLDRLLAEGLYFSQDEVAARPASGQTPKEEALCAFELMEDIKVKLNRILFDLRLPDCASDVFTRLEAVTLSLQYACAKDTDSSLASLHLDYESSYGVVHHLQAAMLCELIGKRLGIKEAERRVLVKAAITHDIGVHDIQNILDCQAEPLSDQQKARIKSHPQDGTDLLSDLGVTERLWLDAVLYHHERIDGSGYPSQRLGESIAVPTRILAVSDIYSAMVRDRPYRKALVSKDAMRQMLVGQGKTIDSSLTQLMIKEVGVFPPGSIVKLSNGEVAVVKQRSDNTALPIVYAFVKPDGLPRSTPARRQTNTSDCSIEGLVPFSRYRAATSAVRGLWSVGS